MIFKIKVLLSFLWELARSEIIWAVGAFNEAMDQARLVMACRRLDAKNDEFDVAATFNWEPEQTQIAGELESFSHRPNEILRRVNRRWAYRNADGGSRPKVVPIF